MADSGSVPYEDPIKQRRSQAGAGQTSQITFAHRALTTERLQALKEFLKHAKSDEIAAIRGLYGDMPEVLQMIGLEIMPAAPALDAQTQGKDQGP